METQPRFVLPVDAEIELRLFGADDAPELFGLIERDRSYLREWLPWVDYELAVEDSQRFITRSLQHYLDNESFDLGIHYHGQLTGVIGFHTFNWPNRHADIGYWLGVAWQGRGVMTRSCRAMVNYAFRKLQLNRISVHCASGNTRSRAIPERLKFTQEGVLRDGEWLNDRFVDLAIYSMLAREWDALHPGLE